MKYVKKPIPVEAIKVEYEYKNSEEICDFINNDNICPAEHRPDYTLKIDTLKINTLNGIMQVFAGDWLLKGEDGKGGFHFWPVSDEYFKHNYEKGEE